MSTTTKIEKFQFEDTFTLRAFVRDGEAWFMGRDVATALGYTRTVDAARYLDEDEKAQVSIDVLHPHTGAVPGTTLTIINESGLYSLILRSRKPEAKRFKKWITAEVLPTIRKTAGYLTPAAQADLLMDPDNALAKLIEVAQVAQEARAKLAQAEEKIALDAPKVEADEQLFEGEQLHTTTEVARMFGMGPYEFRDLLRQWGWLTVDQPAVARTFAVNLGYCVNKLWIHPTRESAHNTAKITRKGIERISIKLNREAKLVAVPA